MAASKGWIKSAFLQRQCYVVNRDVVCHLPPEAGHPPCIAARLKNPAYGMNGASRRWWNILDKARCSYGMVPKRFFYHIPLEPMLVRTHWVTVQCATSEIVRATVECVYTHPSHTQQLQLRGDETAVQQKKNHLQHDPVQVHPDFSHPEKFSVMNLLFVRDKKNLKIHIHE